MNFLKTITSRYWPQIIAATISLFYTIFLLFPLIMMVVNKPQNTINLMVAHYYEDYYEYLSFVKQGQQGHLVLQNLFTNDDAGKFFLSWWLYSLMGFTSYITQIKIPVWIIYWLYEAIFLFLFFLLTYFAISQVLNKKSPLLKLSAFALTIFASPLFNISFKNNIAISPFNYWYSIGIPFSRYNSGTPHHLISEVILLLGILTTLRVFKNGGLLKKFIVFFIFSLLLLITSPPLLIIYWFAILLSFMIEKFSRIKSIIAAKKYLFIDGLIYVAPLFFASVLSLLLAALFNKLSLESPTLTSSRLWELNNLYYPPASLFILSIGLLFFLAILGLPIYFSSWESTRAVFFLIFLLGAAMTLIPINFLNKNVVTIVGIHNLRFFNPNAYIFLGASAALLIEKIAKRPARIFIITCAILTVFFISLGTLWRNKIKTKAIYDEIGQQQYMTKDLYYGISLLENSKNKGIVLTSPASNLGLIIPALTGRKVYYGRSIFTLDIDNKRNKAINFYSMRMTKDEAKNFLQKERIDSIILTGIDSDKKLLMDYYRFLKEEFSNNQVALMRVN